MGASLSNTMQVVVVLVILVGIVTQVLSLFVTCYCNGVTRRGRGDCSTLYRGRPFCYVDQSSCTDAVQSTTPGLYWSYEACGSGTQIQCKTGYNIYPGENDCCDSNFKPSRCCHAPGFPDVYCT